MKRAPMMLAIVIASLLLVTMIPVSAGGWASVRYDSDPLDVVAGESYVFELSVWAHDRAETDVEEVSLVAQHRETGDEITATGESTGEMGHYTVQMTFPTDGEWKLTALIPPYPDFALPTLTVLTSVADRSDLSDALNIELIAGSCGSDFGQPADLIDLIPLGKPEQGLWGQIDTPLADLLGSPSALVLRGDGATALACADLENAIGADRVVVPMAPIDGDGDSGLAVLDANGEQTSITFYPLTISAPARVATIDIAGSSENWSFEPASLEIEPGTMVVWRNLTGVVHTIAGASLDFEDSALIEPGSSFVQVFSEPGTYNYLCGPHQWMTGTVTVTE